MNLPTFNTFPDAIDACKGMLSQKLEPVRTERWQGMDVGSKADMHMHEVEHVSFMVPVIRENLDLHRRDIGPSAPWADEHFEERVCGKPINPGDTWKRWPYGHSASTFLEHGKFNHNYMERYWPKFAGAHAAPTLFPDEFDQGNMTPHFGIYHPYGDLGDIVNQLVRDPTTRQAYMPVWFPEDTGVVHGSRVPCSIGYHFMLRQRRLSITYQLRSCDFVRHFRDDIYLTLRLLLWVLDRCREKNPAWKSVRPGMFIMHISSLHCFRNDWIEMFGGAK